MAFAVFVATLFRSFSLKRITDWETNATTKFNRSRAREHPHSHSPNRQNVCMCARASDDDDDDDLSLRPVTGVCVNVCMHAALVAVYCILRKEHTDQITFIFVITVIFLSERARARDYDFDHMLILRTTERLNKRMKENERTNSQPTDRPTDKQTNKQNTQLKPILCHQCNWQRNKQF